MHFLEYSIGSHSTIVRIGSKEDWTHLNENSIMAINDTLSYDYQRLALVANPYRKPVTMLVSRHRPCISSVGTMA